MKPAMSHTDKTSQPSSQPSQAPLAGQPLARQAGYRPARPYHWIAAGAFVLAGSSAAIGGLTGAVFATGAFDDGGDCLGYNTERYSEYPAASLTDVLAPVGLEELDLIDSLPVAEVAPASVVDAPGFDRKLVVNIGGQPYVSLTNEVNASWLTDKPVLLADDMWIATRHPIDSAALPEAYRSLLHTGVDVFNQAGVTCTARISGFSAVSRFLGYDEEMNAADAWRESAGGAQLLVAELDEIGHRCTEAVWARTSNRGPVAVAAISEDISPRTNTAIQAAFRDLPEYLEIQRQFAEESAGDTPWAEGLLVSEVRGSNEHLLIVSASGGHCEEFSGMLSAMWRVQSDGSFIRVPMQSVSIATPSAAVDTDGDGHLELIFDEDLGHTRILEPGLPYRVVEEVYAPIWTCRC